jgi:hypothetical protein
MEAKRTRIIKDFAALDIIPMKQLNKFVNYEGGMEKKGIFFFAFLFFT